MGLDIYLYTQAEHNANETHERLWEETFNKYHDETTGELRPTMTKERYREESNRVVPPYRGHEECNSEKYPDHLFKRNYLRSSYNESGFNHAVPDMLGRKADLYWIFRPVIGDRDEPYETPLDVSSIEKLEHVKIRALEIAGALRVSDSLRTMHVSTMLGSAEHMWSDLPSEDEALAWYRAEQERHQSGELPHQHDGEEYSYSNAKGAVFGFTKGIEILAATLGRNPLQDFSKQLPINTLGGQMGILPGVILIYRMADEGKESYIQSAEIIAEFCDEAIGLIKRDGTAIMHWSG